MKPCRCLFPSKLERTPHFGVDFNSRLSRIPEFGWALSFVES